MERKKLLIADDSEMNRAILANMLEQDFEIMEVSDGKEALAALQIYRKDLSALLLDIVMPEMDGFQVLEEMKQRQWLEDVPTVMISAETGSGYIDRAFELGAVDYINRPFSATVVRQRIINTILLHTRRQEDDGHPHQPGLPAGEEQRGDAVHPELRRGIPQRRGRRPYVRRGVPDRASAAAADGGDGAILPDPEDVNLICTASGLHDIGKLLVPEDILQKPGKLTDEEFAIIKTHTAGAQILSELPMHRNEKLVKYAIEICRWHHERWNGEGYPDGLSGDHIPIAAQVVSLADAYDALTSKRSYKQAFSHEKAVEMIHNGECGSYNPLLLRCLDDVSDTAKQGMKDAGQTVAPLRRVVEELYKGQDLAAARMTQQLEDAYAKQDFFTSLSDELWFDYTAQPSSLHLLRGLAEQTGLPAVMLEPLQSPTLQMYLGKELTEGLKRQLEGLTLEETRLDLTTKCGCGATAPVSAIGADHVVCPEAEALRRSAGESHRH